MAESRPRDLTAAELELLKEPMRRGSESVPLAVPPGTQVPVHLLDPTAADPAVVRSAPSLEPPGAATTRPSASTGQSASTGPNASNRPNARVKKRRR
jgi:hypothetical protein